MSPSPSSANPSSASCPTCKSQVAAGTDAFPFCSSRCKQVDLGRWFNESYKVSRPIEQADLDEE